MNVGIIGAGPAGLTAAFDLAKAGVDVTVFEASSRVGGLAGTLELWGQRVDFGPHRFFSYDARVNKVWLEVVGRDYRMVSRLTRIYYDGRFYDYPLKAFNALATMGLPRALGCVWSYLREKLAHISRRAPSEPASFEDWVVSRFGRRLFEMFFKSYSEKLWGITCHELDADFAAQRIKKFSLGQAVMAAVRPVKNKHKTLVDEFAYPVGGTGMVYERMAEKVRSHGGTIHLSTPVKGIVRDSQAVRGIEMQDGSVRPFDHVISTMPLTLLVKSLGNLPQAVEHAASALTYRNTIIVYLRVAAANLFKDQWLYIHSPELRLGRLTNFRNWVPELHGGADTTILALEYWCYAADEIWSASDAELIALGTRELAQTGLSGKARVVDGHVHRIPRCYPVYQKGYKELLAPIVDHLRGIPGITAIGRYGAFKYNNQDHSILMGLYASENLHGGSSHDLWNVNTDYDSYQETALIGESGLIMPQTKTA